MPSLRTSIDEPTEHVSIETELAAEWKFQTGPLAPTELLHADLSKTLGTLTLSAAGGQPPVIADLSKTLGSLTVSSAGTVVSPGITANLSKTLGALTRSAAGTNAVAADLSKTLGSLTLVAGDDDMYWDSVVQVTGSNFTTTSLTLVDVTGLSLAASANTKYEVEAMLVVESTTTAGLTGAIAYSAAGATGTYLAMFQSTAGAATIDSEAIGSAWTVNAAQANGTQVTVWLKAVVLVGVNAGNITVQVKKTTSGTATVYIGSSMKVKLLA